MFSVSYRFKSNREEDTQRFCFNNAYVSVRELKEYIESENGLTSGVELEDAETGEVYRDDGKVAKNSLVLVSRIAKKGHRGGGNMSHSNAKRPLLSSQAPPLGLTYICNRCRKPGHYIQNCPTNGNPDFDRPLQRFVGIPLSMTKRVSSGDPSKPTLMLPDGNLAVLVPNDAVFEAGRASLMALEAEKKSIPEDFRCSMCQAVYKCPFVVPCCNASFCKSCIEPMTSTDPVQCPICRKVSPFDKLMPNIELETKIKKWRETGEIMDSSENDLATLNKDNQVNKSIDGNVHVSPSSGGDDDEEADNDLSVHVMLKRPPKIKRPLPPPRHGQGLVVTISGIDQTDINNSDVSIHTGGGGGQKDGVSDICSSPSSSGRSLISDESSSMANSSRTINNSSNSPNCNSRSSQKSRSTNVSCRSTVKVDRQDHPSERDLRQSKDYNDRQYRDRGDQQIHTHRSDHRYKDENSSRHHYIDNGSSSRRSDHRYYGDEKDSSSRYYKDHHDSTKRSDRDNSRCSDSSYSDRHSRALDSRTLVADMKDRDHHDSYSSYDRDYPSSSSNGYNHADVRGSVDHDSRHVQPEGSSLESRNKACNSHGHAVMVTTISSSNRNRKESNGKSGRRGRRRGRGSGYSNSNNNNDNGGGSGNFQNNNQSFTEDGDHYDVSGSTSKMNRSVSISNASREVIECQSTNNNGIGVTESGGHNGRRNSTEMSNGFHHHRWDEEPATLSIGGNTTHKQEMSKMNTGGGSRNNSGKRDHSRRSPLVSKAVNAGSDNSNNSHHHSNLKRGGKGNNSSSKRPRQSERVAKERERKFSRPHDDSLSCSHLALKKSKSQEDGLVYDSKHVQVHH